MKQARPHHELARLIDDRLRDSPEMVQGLREGLMIARATEPTPRFAAVYPTAVCFVAQGSKAAHAGGQSYRYDAGHFLISTMSMPAESEIVEATAEQPLLSLALDLDLRRLARIVSELGPAQAETPQHRTAIAAFEVSDLLADSVYRLMRVATNDEEWRVFGDGALNEVYYRLLAGEAGGLLRGRLSLASGLDQVGRAITFIEENLSEQLTVESVARSVGMSSSALYAKFKAATAQSPMQFVKRLRLNSARNSLLEGLSVTEVAFRVGYSSASQFSREFTRHYGVPPSKIMTKAAGANVVGPSTSADVGTS